MPEARELPERVTLPLLTLITQQSFDEDYEQVAERRRVQGRPAERSPGRSHRMAAVVVAVFGILVAAAAVQTSRNAGLSTQSRETLVSQITERTHTVSRLQDQIVGLRRAQRRLSDRLAAATRTGDAAAARLRTLETVTGYGAVTGPGVKIMVDDAPNGDRPSWCATRTSRRSPTGSGTPAPRRSRSTASGSPRSARSATSGITIHVNSRPVSPPYTVRAIGDEQTLQARLLETTHGQKFYSLVDQLGFRFSMQNEDSLSLPAATPARPALGRREDAGPEGRHAMTEGTTP